MIVETNNHNKQNRNEELNYESNNDEEEYLEQRENPRDSIRGQMNLKNGEYIFQYGDELLKEVQ